MSPDFLVTTVKDLLVSWPFDVVVFAAIFYHRVAAILTAIEQKIKGIKEFGAGSFKVVFVEPEPVQMIPKIEKVAVEKER